MSDKNTLESDQPASGDAAQASAASQEPSGDQPPSSGETFTRAEMEDYVDRKLQSQKDRRFAEIEKKQDTLLDYYQAQTGQPVDPAALARAQREQQIDKLLGQQQPPPSQPAAPARGQQANGQDYTAVLKTYELDSSDPAVADLVKQNAPAADFAFLAGQRKAGPTGSIASVASTGSGTPAPGVTQEQLLEEHNKKMAAARGNHGQMAQIRKESKEKGLKLDVPA